MRAREFRKARIFFLFLYYFWRDTAVYYYAVNNVVRRVFGMCFEKKYRAIVCVDRFVNVLSKCLLSCRGLWSSRSNFNRTVFLGIACDWRYDTRTMLGISVLNFALTWHASTRPDVVRGLLWHLALTEWLLECRISIISGNLIYVAVYQISCDIEWWVRF